MVQQRTANSFGAPIVIADYRGFQIRIQTVGRAVEYRITKGDADHLGGYSYTETVQQVLARLKARLDSENITHYRTIPPHLEGRI